LRVIGLTVVVIGWLYFFGGRYNRFVRWRGAVVWDQIMDALAVAHDAAVQMDTSIVRVYQHGACITNNGEQHMGRSRGGLTSKIRVVVDGKGLPVLRYLPRRARLLADRGYAAPFGDKCPDPVPDRGLAIALGWDICPRDLI
jgi:hypothetical protein